MLTFTSKYCGSLHITLVNTEHLFGRKKDVLTLTSLNLESLGISVCDFGLGMATEFCSEKIPRNRLETDSV